VIGSAALTRTGNKVKVSTTLSRATANTEYNISIWFETKSGLCEYINGITNVTTNKRGEGSGGGESEVPEEAKRFFVAAYAFPTKTFTFTPAVTLP